MRGDDVSTLFQPPPAAAAQPVMFRQGTVVTFDKISLANTVRVDGVELHDLPLLGAAEATTLQADDVVGLQLIGTTWAIAGQYVIPGSAQAARALSVTSANTYSASVSAAEATTSTTFTDLSTVGPTISGVTIGSTGRCLVYISAILSILTAAEGGEMGFEISGATTVSAGDGAKILGHYGTVGGQIAASRVWLQEGLNAGIHEFKAKYAYGGGAGSVRFAQRNLTVVAL